MWLDSDWIFFDRCHLTEGEKKLQLSSWFYCYFCMINYRFLLYCDSAFVTAASNFDLLFIYSYPTYPSILSSGASLAGSGLALPPLPSSRIACSPRPGSFVAALRVGSRVGGSPFPHTKSWDSPPSPPR